MKKYETLEVIQKNKIFNLPPNDVITDETVVDLGTYFAEFSLFDTSKLELMLLGIGAKKCSNLEKSKPNSFYFIFDSKKYEVLPKNAFTILGLLGYTCKGYMKCPDMNFYIDYDTVLDDCAKECFLLGMKLSKGKNYDIDKETAYWNNGIPEVTKKIYVEDTINDFKNKGITRSTIDHTIYVKKLIFERELDDEESSKIIDAILKNAQMIIAAQKQAEEEKNAAMKKAEEEKIAMEEAKKLAEEKKKIEAQERAANRGHDIIYFDAITDMQFGDYEKAIQKFEKIHGYKDVDSLLVECKKHMH